MSETLSGSNQYELPDEDPNQFELFSADEGTLKDSHSEADDKPVRHAPDLLIDTSSDDRPINKL